MSLVHTTKTHSPPQASASPGNLKNAKFQTTPYTPIELETLELGDNIVV